MKKVLSFLLVGVFLIMFVMSVYCYGTNKRYSAWYHFQCINNEFESYYAYNKIEDIWNGKDVFYYRYEGDGAGGYVPVYAERIDSIPDSWEGVKSFFGKVKGFFVRMEYTIRLICDKIIAIGKMTSTLLPWNGLVDCT